MDAGISIQKFKSFCNKNFVIDSNDSQTENAYYDLEKADGVNNLDKKDGIIEFNEYLSFLQLTQPNLKINKSKEYYFCLNDTNSIVKDNGLLGLISLYKEGEKNNYIYDGIAKAFNDPEISTLTAFICKKLDIDKDEKILLIFMQNIVNENNVVRGFVIDKLSESKSKDVIINYVKKLFENKRLSTDVYISVIILLDKLNSIHNIPLEYFDDERNVYYPDITVGDITLRMFIKSKEEKLNNYLVKCLYRQDVLVSVKIKIIYLFVARADQVSIKALNDLVNNKNTEISAAAKDALIRINNKNK